MSGCREDACLGLCCNDLRDRIGRLEQRYAELAEMLIHVIENKLIEVPK